MFDFGFTAIPNEFLDRIASGLSHVELRVMLYIYRHTLGYRKIADWISYSQFTHGVIGKDGTRQDNGAGLSRRSLVTALASLEDKGLIKRSGKLAKCEIALTYLACGNVDNLFTDSSEKVQKVQEVAVKPVQVLHRTKEISLQNIKTNAINLNVDNSLPDKQEQQEQQQQLVNAIVARIPNMPKSQAAKLVKQAYSKRVAAAVWLYALLEYVLTSSTVKSPVAVFTWFVQNNKDAPQLLFTNNFRNKNANLLSVDLSKFAPGGKYAHVVGNRVC